MQARSEFGTAAQSESTAGRGNPGAGSFKSKRPLALIATPDLDLWAQLGPMLEATCSLRHADSLVTAATMLKPGTRTILIADLRGQNPEDFAPISASPHKPVVIAIRDSASAGTVDALMLEGAIQSLVDSPVESAAMLRAINDAARISSTADALSAVTSPSSGSSGGDEKSGKSPALIVGVVVAVLAAAGAGWFFMSKGSSDTAPVAANNAAAPTAAAPAAGKASAAAPAASLDEVLEKARLAMDERRYIEPAKNNALEHFRTVLQLEPGNAEATEGLKRLGGLLIARARTALDERRFDNALAELEAARSIDPNDQRLVEVDARLDSMRAQTALAQIQATLAAQNFDRAQTLLDAAQKDALLPPAQLAQLSKDLDNKRRAVTVGRLVASAESRLASGRLVTPNDESAKDAIQSLREAGASAEVIARLNNDLNQRLLAAARDAAAKGDQAGMQATLAAARENGVSASALNAAQRDMTAAAQKQQRTNEDIARFAKAAQDRLASGNLLAPANDSAVSNAERLRLLDVRHPTTLQVVRDVRARLLTEARARLSGGGKPTDAAALLDAAESLGGDSDLGELRAALASAQQAAAAAAAAPKLPPLKMTRPPKPKYPASAKGVEGWVRVEFFVTPQGRAERVRVLSSEPAGLFDAAAISAMEGARFEEFDSPDARLAVQRIVFKPE